MSGPRAIKRAEVLLVSQPKTLAIRSCLSSRVTQAALAVIGLIGLAFIAGGFTKFLSAYSIYSGISLFAFSVAGLIVSILAAPSEQKKSKVIKTKKPVKKPEIKHVPPPATKPVAEIKTPKKLKKKAERKRPAPKAEEKKEVLPPKPKKKKPKELAPDPEDKIPEQPKPASGPFGQVKERQEIRAAVSYFEALIQEATTYQDLEEALIATKKSVAAYHAISDSAPFETLTRFEKHLATLQEVLDVWKKQALLQNLDESFRKAMLETRQIVQGSPSAFSLHYSNLYLRLVQQASSMRLYQCCQHLKAADSPKKLQSALSDTAEAYSTWKKNLGGKDPFVILPPALPGTFSQDLPYYLSIVEFAQTRDWTKLHAIPEEFLKENLGLANALIEDLPKEDPVAKKVLILASRQAGATFQTVASQEQLESALNERQEILSRWSSCTDEAFPFEEEYSHYPTIRTAFEALNTLSSADSLTYEQIINLHTTSERLSLIPDAFYETHFPLTQLLLQTLESINSKPREAAQTTSQTIDGAVDFKELQRQRAARANQNGAQAGVPKSGQSMTDSCIEKLKKIQKRDEPPKSEPVEAALLALDPPRELENPAFTLDVQKEISRANSSLLLKQVIEEITLAIGEPRGEEEQTFQTFRADQTTLLEIAKSWKALETLANKSFFIDRDIEKIILLLEKLPEKDSELYTRYPSLRQQLNRLMSISIKQVGVLKRAQKRDVQMQALDRANTLAKKKLVSADTNIFVYMEAVIEGRVKNPPIQLLQSKNFERDYQEFKANLQAKINKIQEHLKTTSRYAFTTPSIELPIGEAALLLQSSLTAPQADWGALFQKINSLTPTREDLVWRQSADVKTQLANSLRQFHARPDLNHLLFGSSGAGQRHDQFKENVLSVSDKLGVEFEIDDKMKTENDESDAVTLQIHTGASQAFEAYTNALRNFSDLQQDEGNTLALSAAHHIISQLPQAYQEDVTTQFMLLLTSAN